mmetsp:Transcript_47620/g.101940  ORF Transcript_47620/g.101940 Transcript_47620/m.101940 type:complete len:613 (-) Transcript_47620:106-1944(-)
MITYTSGGIWYFLKLFQMRGSVFPSAMVVAIPCTFLAAVLRIFIDRGDLGWITAEDSILKETQAWAGFSFLVGFLVVFRTSQAYSRFWDGSSATHRMRAEWFDACSSLMAFCRHSTGLEAEVSKFRNILIRLFSMLHACALAELEEVNAELVNIEQVHSMHFDLIDPQGLDEESLLTIKHSNSKVELIFTWIQFTIVDNIKTGVLAIPPPILSRSFQEIANGMVAFHDAIKISYIPFPFPYAQTCDCLLVLHWMVVPFVTSQWVTQYYWAAIFVFIQVFILWALNFIAVEIENPFGADANDLDGAYMQKELNRHLMLLLQTETLTCPGLSSAAMVVEQCPLDQVRLESFIEAWGSCDSDEDPAAMTCRMETIHAGPRRSARMHDTVSSGRGSNHLDLGWRFTTRASQAPSLMSEENRSRSAASLDSLNAKYRQSRINRVRSSLTEEARSHSPRSPRFLEPTSEEVSMVVKASSGVTGQCSGVKALSHWTDAPHFAATPNSQLSTRSDMPQTYSGKANLTSSIQPGVRQTESGELMERPQSTPMSHENSFQSVPMSGRLWEANVSDSPGLAQRIDEPGTMPHPSGPVPPANAAASSVGKKVIQWARGSSGTRC